jgi:hypothetical protein
MERPDEYVIPAIEWHEPRSLIRDLPDLEITNTSLFNNIFTLGDPGSTVHSLNISTAGMTASNSNLSSHASSIKPLELHFKPCVQPNPFRLGKLVDLIHK